MEAQYLDAESYLLKIANYEFWKTAQANMAELSTLQPIWYGSLLGMAFSIIKNS